MSKRSIALAIVGCVFLICATVAFSVQKISSEHRTRICEQVVDYEFEDGDQQYKTICSGTTRITDRTEANK